MTRTAIDQEQHRTHPRSVLGRVLIAAIGSVALASAIVACSSSSTAANGPASGPGSATSVTTASAATTSNSITSNSASSPAAAGSSASGDETMAGMIHIQNFRFMVPAQVAPGAKITVMNMDGEAHTVTSDSDGAFNVAVPAGQSVTLVAPTKPGSYPFHCNLHANMHGVLVVK